MAKQQISTQQKLILEVLAEQVSEMKTENDLQYALKGLFSELTHLANNEFFDPIYISQKARLIKMGIEK